MSPDHSRKRAPRVAATLLLLLSSITAFAQPVQVPQIQPPQFQSQDLNPAFESARTASNMGQWEHTVLASLTAIEANWEAAVDAQIAQEMGLVSQSDAFNANPEYQLFIQNALLLQKQESMYAWEEQADALIQQNRTVFLTSLNAGSVEQAQEGAKDALTQAQTPQSNPVSQEHQEWRNDYNAQLEQGFYDYQSALGALGQDYAAYLQEMNATDQQFQQNLGNLQASEQRVRDGIQAQTLGMRDYLNNTGLFYDQNGNLNAEGLELKTLLDSLDQNLANNAPLSQLTVQMVDYLERQQVAAQQTEQSWRDITRGSQDMSQSFFSPVGSLTRWNIDLVRHVADWLDSNKTDDAALKAYLAAQTGKTIESLSPSIDVCGRSDTYNIITNVLGAKFTGECYSNAGLNAFTWEAWGIVGTCPLCLAWPWGVSETYADVRNLTFTWYDANADQNANTWSGYKNDLTSAAANWRNTLLPAIENWETQVTDYQARYAQWQAQASTDVAQTQTAYQTAAEEISRQRGLWLSEMEDQKRRTEAQWFELGRREAVDSVAFKPTNAAQTLASVAAKLPGINQSLLGRADEGTPDASILDKFSSFFEKSLNGAGNNTMAHALDREAKNSIEEAIQAQVDAAKQLDGMVQKSLRYAEIYGQVLKEKGLTSDFDAERDPRAKEVGDEVQLRLSKLTDNLQVVRHANGNIEVVRDTLTGRAILGAMGDPTKASSYKAVMERGSFTILRPDAIKLASAGSLMDAWNFEELEAQKSKHQKEFEEALNRKFEAFNRTVSAQQDEIDKRVKGFQADAQRQAETWNKIKSLAISILTGGTWETWLQGEVRGEISNAIAQVTGLPASFISGLMSGQPPHEAVASMLEGYAWQNFEAATGIEGISSTVQTLMGQLKQKQEKRDAAQIKKSDVVAAMAGGPAGLLTTYTMRNAQHNKTFANIEKAVSYVPLVNRAYAMQKTIYTQGGGLKVVEREAKSALSEMAETYKSAFKGDLFSARTIAAMTGVPTLMLEEDFRNRLEQKPQTFEQYTGLDNLGRTVNTLAQQAAEATRNAATQIATNTIRGAADLSGNRRLSQKIKMRGDLDYALADDMGNNFSQIMRYGSTGTLAFLNPTAAPYIVGAALTKQGQALGANFQEDAHRSMRAAFHKSPTLMDAAAFAGSMGTGCGQCYYAFSARKGWVLGGDTGAVVEVGNTVLQGLLVIASAGTASAATGGTGSVATTLANAAKAAAAPNATVAAQSAGLISNLATKMSTYALTGSMQYRRDTGWNVRAGIGPPGLGTIGGNKVDFGFDYTTQGGVGFSAGMGNEAGKATLGWSRNGGVSVGAGTNFKVPGSEKTDSLGFDVGVGYNFNSGFNTTFGRKGFGNVSWNEQDRFGANADLSGLAANLGISPLPPGLNLNYFASQRGKSGASVSLNELITYDTAQDNFTVSLDGAAWGATAANIRGSLNTLHNGKAKFLADNLNNPALTDDLADKIAELEQAGKLKPGASQEEIAAALGTLSDAELNVLMGADHANKYEGQETSRGDGLWANLKGGVYDGISTFAGFASDEYAMIDRQGEFQESTCFAKDTLVAVYQGTPGAFERNGNHYKLIQDIRQGDLVWSYNEATQSLQLSPVSKTFIRQTERVYTLDYDSGTQIQTTGDHPFMLEGRGWRDAKMLRAGDDSLLAREVIGMHEPRGPPILAQYGARVVLAGSAAKPRGAIVSITSENRHETVYNFEVASTHTYLVTEDQVVVHNAGPWYDPALTVKMASYYWSEQFKLFAKYHYARAGEMARGEHGYFFAGLAGPEYIGAFVLDLIGAGIPANELDFNVAILTYGQSLGYNITEKVGQKLLMERLRKDGIAVTSQLEQTVARLGLQWHHFATNKNKTFTPRMANIADRYGLPLDGPWNKELLPHLGRHPNEYHEFVLQGMQRASREAGNNMGKFLQLYETYVKAPIRAHPELLRKDGWRSD